MCSLEDRKCNYLYSIARQSSTLVNLLVRFSRAHTPRLLPSRHHGSSRRRREHKGGGASATFQQQRYDQTTARAFCRSVHKGLTTCQKTSAMQNVLCPCKATRPPSHLHPATQNPKTTKRLSKPRRRSPSTSPTGLSIGKTLILQVKAMYLTTWEARSLTMPSRATTIVSSPTGRLVLESHTR